MTHRRYVVLGGRLEPDELFRRMEEGLTELHQRTGHLFGYSLSRESETGQAVEHIWRMYTGDPSLISLIDDRAHDVLYAMIQTPDPELATATAEALAAHLPAASLEELQRRATESGAPPAGLVRLALATGEEPDPRVRQILGQALESPDPAMQEAAIMAAALTRDSELIPALERLRDATPDDGLRAMAQQAISDCGGEPR